MPYQVKNRFLILGLTGPLGSGCSTTARFLSGMPFDFQVTIKELLQIQVSQLKELDEKIKKEYQKIDSNKENVRDRLAKRLGPYKQSWIDPNKDDRIEVYEKEIKKIYSKLKIYLKRREIYKILNEFLNSEYFEKKNINDIDRQAFGLTPFCYISFTTIIVKLAFERYIKDGGKRELDNFFLRKLNKVNKETSLEEAYKNIKKYIKNKFNIDGDLINAYTASSKYMRNRVYQFALQTDVLGNEELKSHFNNKMAKFFNSFYEFIIKTDEILTALKKYTAKKGNAYPNVLSEILQDWGDNIRATGNPFTFVEDLGNPPYDNLFVLSNEINVLIKALRFRIRYLDSSFKYSGNRVSEPDCLFVIECFRNPYEIEFFRSRYSEFYLLSISTKRSVREKRIGKYFSENRDKRDEGKYKKTDELYKLDVRSCVLLSDIAILNDYQGKQSFFEKFLRYFALIRNPGCIPPNDNELYMHIAYSHSLKSTCISRKVGAVILGPQGYILGAGWNDAGDGQIGCGMRNKNDLLNIDCIPLTSNVNDLKKFKEILREKDSEYVCYKDIILLSTVVGSRKRLLAIISTC